MPARAAPALAIRAARAIFTYRPDGSANRAPLRLAAGRVKLIRALMRSTLSYR
ncbi:hypothetical protein QOZ99_001980 [Angulomicrobium amanitiforme]|uniref:Uncharacterized protein n=1 Tax=Ancylobacter amanitiformis TaxID=217069 RepID=A0ABU0LQV6_9HYPH|nr:hypothetical protein [Ancylobacter amanitiformis]